VHACRGCEGVIRTDSTQLAHHHTGRFPQASDCPSISAVSPSFSMPRAMKMHMRACHACMYTRVQRPGPACHAWHALLTTPRSGVTARGPVIITRACTHAMHEERVQRPGAPRRSVPRHVVARQRAATRAVSGRGQSRTRGPPTTCLLPYLIRPTSNRARKPREAAVCLRASADAISRSFADTIDSVVSPSADRGILRYSILSYDSLA
jgi:hypothetical protein